MPRRKSTNLNSSSSTSAIALLDSDGEVVEAELVDPAQSPDPEQIRQQAIADAEDDFDRFYLPAYQQRMQELIQQYRATVGVGLPNLNDVINSMNFSL